MPSINGLFKNKKKFCSIASSWMNARRWEEQKKLALEIGQLLRDTKLWLILIQTFWDTISSFLIARCEI